MEKNKIHTKIIITGKIVWSQKNFYTRVRSSIILSSSGRIPDLLDWIRICDGVAVSVASAPSFSISFSRTGSPVALLTLPILDSSSLKKDKKIKPDFWRKGWRVSLRNSRAIRLVELACARGNLRVVISINEVIIGQQQIQTRGKVILY